MGDGRGISQAEAMRRRVSPEGRRLAALDQARRRRASGIMFLQALCVVVAIVTAWDAWHQRAGSPGQIAEVLVCILLLGAILLTRHRRRSVGLAGEALPALPDRMGEWLAEQRAILPAPATTLIDAIRERVDALSPHLLQLDPTTPAADDVRKLLGRELPGLVDQYHAVPATLRGGEADAQLLHGLGVVDRQLDALTRQIASGAVDGLATQDRFLESKYSGGV